jgi:hypothetical protein
VRATRYVAPLREGGSLPGLLEADDDGLYVVKFRGAGQGVKALVAEMVAGELGRALGLPVPELVVVDVDPELTRAEPDPEIQELVAASGGGNLGMDFLPGAVTFNPAADPAPDPELAAAVVWFDGVVANVDRTARNPNLLVWHRRLHLIDHGAALYAHHAWRDPAGQGRGAFPLLAQHVLLPFAAPLAGVDEQLAPLVDGKLLDAVLRLVPDDWLAGDPVYPDPEEHRSAYRTYLLARVEARQGVVPTIDHGGRRAAR